MSSFPLPAASRPGTPTRLAGWIAFWALAALLAYLAARRAEAQPFLLLAPAAIGAVVLLVKRRPALAVGALAIAAGGTNALLAYTPIPPKTLIDALLVAFLVAAAIDLTQRRHALRIWPGVIPLLGLVLVALAYVALDENRAYAWSAFRDAWLYLVAALGLAYVGWSPQTTERAGKAMLVAAAALGGYAIFRWVTGPATQELDQALAVGANYIIVDDEVRVIGAVGDRHGLSENMVALVPLGLAATIALKGRWRMVGLAVTALCFATIVGTEVRSGLAAAGAGMVAVLAISATARRVGPQRVPAIALCLLVAAIGATALVAVSAGEESRLRDRFEAVFDPGSDPAFEEREARWGGAWVQIEEKPGGHGLGTASLNAAGRERFAREGITSVDNAYLKIAYEQGVTVAALFIMLLVVLLGSLVWAALVAKRPWEIALALGGAGALLGYAIQLNFETIYIETPTALTVWLVVGLGLRPLVRPSPP
jgi:hypothetical protein